MRAILNNDGSPVELVEKPNAETVEAKQEAEAIQQTHDAEVTAHNTVVPQKSEGAVQRPNEPTTSNEALGYYNINSQAIERDPELAKLTASPDFISECLQKGLVELYTEEVKERGKKNRYLYADITYNGKTYKRLYVWDNGTLRAKVEALEATKKPGQRIVATAMKRTAGKIQKRKDGKSVSVLDTPLLAGQQLDQLEFTAEDGRFGIVHEGRAKSFAGGNITQPTDIAVNLNMPDGTIVFMKSTNRRENPTEQIPVTVARKTFADSADFIIETLQQFSTADQPYLITINGQQKNLGVTRKQLMSLLLPIVKDVSQADGYSLMQDPSHPSVFHIVVRG
jgi:hypothetical protein